MNLHAQRPARLSFEDVLALLEGVRRSGSDKAMALCPSHGDRGASLSVREGDDRRTLLHCHAGCAVEEITSAMGITVAQLFPERDEPWRPTGPRRPRRDPDRDAREVLHRLSHLHDLPDPDRLGLELRRIGVLLVGGTKAMGEIPPDFSGETFKCLALRIIFYAMQELHRQGTPRRWYSPRAIATVIDRAYGTPGNAKRLGISGWCRTAVHFTREDTP